MKIYTVHRGTVRSSFALYHYVMPIYARQARARAALESGEAVGVVIRGERAELHAATARAEEASKMHLVPFVPPYVPAKASRAFPGLKTCTSPRRAAIARQRALFVAAIGTPEQARASGFKWYEDNIKTGRIRHDPTIAAMYPTAGQMLKWTGITIATLLGDRPRGF